MLQNKLKTLNASRTQKDILELEKKYFEILYKIFSANTFKIELNAIMQNINANWNVIHGLWGKANVVDLAVERHINFRVYNDPSLKGHINAIYPSVISSDTAFVTHDAVINIDSKTNDVDGNKGDWIRQSVSCNQTSFDNKDYWSPQKGVFVKPTTLLQPFHDKKPVLSFFLSTLYHSDKVNKIETWYNDANHKVKPYNKNIKKVENRTISKEPWQTNIKFSCVPHHDLSPLYDNEIISGVKTYKYSPGSPNPIGTSSVRIDHESLKKRLDSKGIPWEGFKNWQI